MAGANSPNLKPVGQQLGAPVYEAMQVNRDFSDVFPASSSIISLVIVTNGGSLEIIASEAHTNLPASPPAPGPTNFITWIEVDGTPIKGMAIAAPNQGAFVAFDNGSALLIGPPDLALVGLSPLAPGPHTVDFRGSVQGPPGFAAGGVVSINALAVPLQQHASLRAREV